MTDIACAIVAVGFAALYLLVPDASEWLLFACVMAYLHIGNT